MDRSRSHGSRALRRGVAALLALCFASTALAGSAITSGHSGHWYTPERDGEGWVLEVLNAERALLYWFTYDEQGNQRWMIAEGTRLSDEAGAERIEFPELVATRGGRFGPGFDPDSVIREVVGSAQLRFDDCDRGWFGFEAYQQSAEFAIERLARVMGTRCETPHGVTGREVSDRAGTSGSWFDPARDGEGYTLHWIDPQRAVVVWFTYDTQGRQFWMIGTGAPDVDGRLVFPELVSTRGGRFGADFDPASVERLDWGLLEFDLACDQGQAVYDSPLLAFSQGQLELRPLTALAELGCPWQRPTLGALYTMSLGVVPGPRPGGEVDALLYTSLRLGADGSLWGLHSVEDRVELLRLRPGAEAWEAVGDQRDLNPSWPPVIAADTVAATERSSPGSSRPVLLNDGSWRLLDAPLDQQGLVSGLSACGGQVLGFGTLSAADPSVAWRWSADEGVVALPRENPRSAVPIGSSSSGDRVLGRTIVLPNDIPRSVLWRDGQASSIVEAENWQLDAPHGCASDCRLVFGSRALRAAIPGPGGVLFPIRPPQLRQDLWYWFEDGRSGWIPWTLPVIPLSRGFLTGMSGDGSVLVGARGVFPSFSGGGDGMLGPTGSGIESFVWTPLTEMVSLREALAKAGVPMDGWADVYVRALSEDGRRLAFVGQRADPDNPGQTRLQLAVVELSPLDWP